MAISPHRKKEIAELAEFIGLEHLGADGVDVLSIVHKKGITHSFGSYSDSFDGLIELKGGRFHIYGNLEKLKTPDSVRSRFTLGHELGHYFIDEHRISMERTGVAHGSIVDGSSDLVVEQEADTFAAHLLLPQQSLLSASKNKQMSTALIRDIATSFRISLTSTAIRLVELDKFPCAIFKSSNGKIEWVSISPSLFGAGFRRKRLSEETIYKDSATRKLESEKSSDTKESVTTATFWFSFTKNFANQNIILKEEALSLGPYGVLTLLSPMEPLKTDES